MTTVQLGICADDETDAEFAANLAERTGAELLAVHTPPPHAGPTLADFRCADERILRKLYLTYEGDDAVPSRRELERWLELHEV